MKFGIIGTGVIGDFHAQAIQAMTGGSLHSVYGRRPEAVAEFAEKFGVKGSSDLDEFLADPELDVVTIATPSGAHLRPSIAALEAGKHVICEKPLEVTTERLDQMIAAAEKSGKVLAAILNRRFNPAMDAFKEAAHKKRFGKLTSASAYIKWYRDQDYYDSGAWRGTWELDGGGALMNQAIHTVDGLLLVAGPVKWIQADAACLAHTGIEVEDMAVCIMEFENGARGVIEASTATWSKNGHPARIQLSGMEGSAFLADEAFEIWDFMEEQPEDKEILANLMKKEGDIGIGANDPKAIPFVAHQNNFEEVVNAIKEGREPSCSAKEARKAVALINAIYESAQNGGKRIYMEGR